MRLKEIRTQRKLSQKEVADYLGISDVSYGRYESGNREPSIEMLIKLSDLFKVTIDYIVGKEDPAFIGMSKYEYALVLASRAADERAKEDAMLLLQRHTSE